MRLLIMLILISGVHPQIQLKHSMRVSRKSRSYFPPSGFGYVYSDYEYDPGVYAMSGNDHHRYYDVGKASVDQQIPTVPSDDYLHTLTNSYSDHLSDSSYATTPVPPSKPITEHYDEPTTKYDVDYERMKSEARYNSRFLPSKLKSDIMYERLKSLMHYKPYSDRRINEIEFDVGNEYHSDDGDDIRTTSRTNNDVFPYFYHGPYEYEYDANVDKGKDKRYTGENYHNVIPVHENISDDIPPYQLNTPYNIAPLYTETTEKSPIAGDAGFFSYVLNDYYDKANDEDPVVFKGMSEWGKAINYDSAYNDDANRPRRHKHKKNFRYHTTPNHIAKEGTSTQGESVTESGHTKKSEYDSGTKSYGTKASDKLGYENHKAGYKGLKDLADSVVHKFGSENHNRDIKHQLKHHKDKGENRRGFHRVYHKDEYMEDKEFFDNNNSSSHGEDKGHSAINNGGSEVLLKSHATANIADESNATRKVGDRENKQSETSNRGHSSSKDADSEFSRYRDVAKKAVQKNSADYGELFF